MEATKKRHHATVSGVGGVGGPTKQRRLDDNKSTQKSMDLAVVHFIVDGLHSFGVVEQPEFMKMLKTPPCNYNVMSRTTLRNYIQQHTQTMKKNVKTRMKELDCVATTTDCWTAHRQSFLGLTAHWIDPDCLKRESAALACRRIKGSHTHENLASCLNEIHAEYGISGKICRTTTDNASNFVKAFRVFGSENAISVDSETDDDSEEETEAVDVDALMEVEDDSFQYQLPKHHRCACHLINLIATVDAKKAEANAAYRNTSRSAFAKCFGLWNKSARSATAAEVIEKECKLQLVRPVETRWNSHFLAVERLMRILRESGEGAIRAVTIALKVPM